MTAPLVNTFSLCARDPENGDLGVVVASKYLAVGAVVPYARAGVGAVATQSSCNVSYGPDGLGLMEKGNCPEMVIKEVTGNDENRETRQVGMVDARGESFSFTGKKAHDWKGHINEEDIACQGNLLAGEKVISDMVKAFKATKGDLSDQLMAALIAGDKAGGDKRGRQSAAILVAREKGGPGGLNDRYLDLRVDEHKEAPAELMRVFGFWKEHWKRR
ncbi:MAG: DUF1028 domain-containing protein [Planctomycetota bacterium]|nr:DUF1028 domain-containing protein [Planctomycetota bacterium]